MATLTNTSRQPVTLPSGHVLPAATGAYDDDLNWIMSAPGVLTTTNDVLQGDNAVAIRGPVAAGTMAAAYDPDPETTTETPHDWIKAQAEQAVAAIAEGEADAKALTEARDEQAEAKAAEEAPVEAKAEPIPEMVAGEPAAEEPAEVVAEPAPAKTRR